MQRIIGLALALTSAAMGFMLAWTIQYVTFGGYVFEAGLALAGGAFVVGVYMTLERR